MTTAQDQQSRAKLLPCPFCGGNAAFDQHDDECYFRKYEAQRRAVDDADLTAAFEMLAAWNRRAPAEQAARTLPAPENVREGEPYDNPAFEDLARTMGVWGTSQSALCAQFFLAGRGAVPAEGVDPMLDTPAGPWKCGNEFLPYHPDASHVNPEYRAGWNDCYTAAQVQAMGRVPPGFVAVPEVPTEDTPYLAQMFGLGPAPRHNLERD